MTSRTLRYTRLVKNRWHVHKWTQPAFGGFVYPFAASERLYKQEALKINSLFNVTKSNKMFHIWKFAHLAVWKTAGSREENKALGGHETVKGLKNRMAFRRAVHWNWQLRYKTRSYTSTDTLFSINLRYKNTFLE